jgi:hypothetical protein
MLWIKCHGVPPTTSTYDNLDVFTLILIENVARFMRLYLKHFTIYLLDFYEWGEKRARENVWLIYNY